MNLHQCIARIADVIVHLPTMIEEHVVDFKVITTTRD